MKSFKANNPRRKNINEKQFKHLSAATIATLLTSIVVVFVAFV